MENCFKKSIMVLMLVVIIALNGCQSISGNINPLNQDNPITVTIWHYYNGHIKDNFDAMVSEFNETTGMEMGIVVETKSHGDVGQLANAVFDAASNDIGSENMPNIFAAYPDNAIRVHKIIGLVDMESYFTDEEIQEYRKEFLKEGVFLNEEKHYIIPVAKSSENLFVNKKYWETFSKKHGYTEADLSTWESILRVAEKYYEETGNSFLGIDAVTNYILMSSMQLGTEIFSYNEDGTASFNFDKDIARKIWDNYYTPYLNGYFLKTGRFSSDDAKTGKTIAYTGSTAGAGYFPTEVTFSQDDIVEIEALVLPYPYFRDGKPFAMQQGAGMCISKSDFQHEYASAEFLKWFTTAENNLKFAVSTGYFPVKNEILNESKMIGAMQEAKITNPAIKASILTTNKMFNEYSIYSTKPFDGSFEIRNFLESELNEKITRDVEIISKQVSAGKIYKDLINDHISEVEFEKWYKDIVSEAEAILIRYK
ncbi:ABC transporter substrate-binding protein [Proteocatella sphenisci]|uniref:ABC transporter substrate-binding protein n=1 Tax=Proteocatella sphenisci TaxID=181070 RepID=UPI00048E4FA3|nr:extracellular solute-binding protein [Proteocatella sphenisci]